MLGYFRTIISYCTRTKCSLRQVLKRTNLAQIPLKLWNRLVTDDSLSFWNFLFLIQFSKIEPMISLFRSANFSLEFKQS